MTQDTPKLWRDMTPEEKGALLLAHHEGKVLEVAYHGTPWLTKTVDHWHDHAVYRVRPEPKGGTVILYGSSTSYFGIVSMFGDTHQISFEVINGDIPTGTYTSEEGNVIKVERIK